MTRTTTHRPAPTARPRPPEGVLAAALRLDRERRRRRRRVLGSALAVLVVAALVVTWAVRAPRSAAAIPRGLGSGAALAPVADGAADGLDPEELARRFAHAQRVAAADGVELTLTSGRRTAREQQDLVDDALERYGSAAEAHRWVLPPERSAHVQGLAIDVGPTEGAQWLGRHGEGLGLCQAYANEVWHFEKLPDGAGRCPAVAADSSGGW